METIEALTTGELVVAINVSHLEKNWERYHTLKQEWFDRLNRANSWARENMERNAMQSIVPLKLASF